MDHSFDLRAPDAPKSAAALEGYLHELKTWLHKRRKFFLNQERLNRLLSLMVIRLDGWASEPRFANAIRTSLTDVGGIAPLQRQIVCAGDQFTLRSIRPRKRHQPREAVERILTADDRATARLEATSMSEALGSTVTATAVAEPVERTELASDGDMRFAFSLMVNGRHRHSPNPLDPFPYDSRSAAHYAGVEASRRLGKRQREAVVVIETFASDLNQVEIAGSRQGHHDGPITAKPTDTAPSTHRPAA